MFSRVPSRSFPLIVLAAVSLLGGCADFAAARATAPFAALVPASAAVNPEANPDIVLVCERYGVTGRQCSYRSLRDMREALMHTFSSGSDMSPYY